MTKTNNDTPALDLGLESRNYENLRPFSSNAGMSDLFLAHKKGLDLDVVIKRVHRQLRRDIDQRNEADVLKTLKHQYLPRIYDVIQGPEGDVYTVMEYVRGENLQQYVQKNGPLGQKQAHKWGCQLCEAVQYLHEEKNDKQVIYHLDIKPSNIMITDSGDICLIDFGTSLICRGQQIASSFLTHGYAAPEQYGNAVIHSVEVPPQTCSHSVAQPGNEGETLPAAGSASVNRGPAVSDGEATLPVQNASQQPYLNAARASRSGTAGGTWAAERKAGISKATDVYAIGATLYYAVTGHKPEPSIGQLTPLDAWHPKISRPMAEIIQRAMQKDPAKRFCDASEMLRALNDVVFRERSYRSFVIQRRLVAVFLIAAYLTSGASLAYGLRQMATERENNYLNLISQAQQARMGGSYEECQSLLEEAIQLQPARSDAYLELAVSLYQSGNYQGALDLLDNAFLSGNLSEKELDAETLGSIRYVQGSCLYELGDYAQSIQQLQAAVEHSQLNPAYYRSLAVALAHSGEIGQAEEILEHLQQMGADRSDCDIVRAEIFAMTGRYKDALNQYSQVFDETDDPYQLSHAYLSAAQLCQDNADADRAIDVLEEAVSRLERSYTLLQREMLAEVYTQKALESPSQQMTWYQKAEQVLAGLIQEGMATMTTQLNYAMVEQSLGKFQEAETVLRTLLEQYPQNYQPDMRLAYLYIDWQGTLEVSQRNYARAKQHYDSALVKYQQAKANGQEDQNMVVLQNLIDQLHDTGWL